jgi:hypothetical protein
VSLFLAGTVLPLPPQTSVIPNGATIGLKFGKTNKDHVLFKPSVEPLQESFSICGWVRKLNSSDWQYWFAYGTSTSPHEEIEISDNGYTKIFNMGFDLRSKITAPIGEWKHSCVTWALSSQAFTVYFEGEFIGTEETASGKKLPADGYMVLGNEFDSYGGGFNENNAFGGELFKVNVFTKELTGAEIKEMSDGGLCSGIELKYGRERYLKWSDFLLEKRSGNVTEVDVGCGYETSKWDILLTKPFLNKPLSRNMIDGLRSGWDILG